MTPSVSRSGQGLPDLSEVLARRIAILGSTGTVGVATLDVVRSTRSRYGEDSFPIEVLAAGQNVAKLVEQALEFRPRAVAIGDESRKGDLESALGTSGIEILAGDAAALEAGQRNSDWVMAAIVGAAGLSPTLAAVERGATVAIANKECVVAAGEVMRKAAEASNATLIPVDSEHNAALQLLDFANTDAISKLTLTASGGPFRTWTLERMRSATPAQAVLHPNWSMGAKISVDSATLMNKGLELIEARLLFDLEPDQLDIVIHPQSVVHCLLSYSDGATLAHLSAPDMRIPIAHALGWPRRLPSSARRVDFSELMSLTFEKPDFTRFPCLDLARTCLQIGGPAPTILNAANEVAVERFLARELGFLGIAATVGQTLEMLAQEINGPTPATLQDVLALDALARNRAQELCKNVAA